jgi:uncharacterized protein YfaS (alpha-2-macroglobulin family)
LPKDSIPPVAAACRPRNRTLISPLPHLVGFKSDGDLDFIHAGSDRRVDWIAITPALDPLALAGLTLKRLEIQHLSTLVKQPNGTFKYQTVDREREIDSQAFAIAEAGTRYPLATDEPGDYAIEVVDSAGTAAGPADLHGGRTWQPHRPPGKRGRPAAQAGQKRLPAGETIRLSITAPYVGAGLITIESDRVHAFKWFKSATESTLETIRLPDGLEGNAYVNVSFVRDAGSRRSSPAP